MWEFLRWYLFVNHVEGAVFTGVALVILCALIVFNVAVHEAKRSEST